MNNKRPYELPADMQAKLEEDQMRLLAARCVSRVLILAVCPLAEACVEAAVKHAVCPSQATTEAMYEARKEAWSKHRMQGGESNPTSFKNRARSAARMLCGLPNDRTEGRDTPLFYGAVGKANEAVASAVGYSRFAGSSDLTLQDAEGLLLAWPFAGLSEARDWVFEVMGDFGPLQRAVPSSLWGSVSVLWGRRDG